MSPVTPPSLRRYDDLGTKSFPNKSYQEELLTAWAKRFPSEAKNIRESVDTGWTPKILEDKYLVFERARSEGESTLYHPEDQRSHTESVDDSNMNMADIRWHRLAWIGFITVMTPLSLLAVFLWLYLRFK